VSFWPGWESDPSGPDVRQRRSGYACLVAEKARGDFGVQLLTFVFSIVGLALYGPMLHPPKFMAGAGGDAHVRAA
jgi:hypothetical protein